MSFADEQQHKSIEESDLQARQESEHPKNAPVSTPPLRASEEFLSEDPYNFDEKEWEINPYLRKTLPYVEADLRALQSQLPKGEMSRSEYIQFFIDTYPSVCELVHDGTSGDLYIKHMQKWFLDRESQYIDKETEDLIGSHETSSILIRTCRSGLLSQALAKFEQDIAEGLGTFEEGQAYYWISFILREQNKSDKSLIEYLTVEPGFRIGTKWKLKQKDANAPLKLAVKQLQRHLRTNPQDVNALKLLVSSYRILERSDALYKAEIELKKAEARTAASPPFSSPVLEFDKSGLKFEAKCQKLLDAMGFTTTTTIPTNDGGIDIIAIRSDPILSGKYIIQCKDWQSPVGVRLVRELYGVVVSEEANKGILITSSQFTQSAIEFTKEKRIELIDGEQLDKLIASYQNKQ